MRLTTDAKLRRRLEESRALIGMIVSLVILLAVLLAAATCAVWGLVHGSPF